VAAPFIFLPFFTLVGAALDLQTFFSSLGFAVILSLARMFCIFCGTAGPGYFLGQVKFRKSQLAYKYSIHKMAIELANSLPDVYS